MEANVQGRVANTRLASSNGLLPVYEAVINSIHSIESRKPENPCIQIRLHRDQRLELQELHGNYLPDIRDITISDNGVGFTDSNLASFNTLDSRAKEASGGKGIGRIYWLKAFELARIESIYDDNGKRLRRIFEFRPTISGVENRQCEEVESDTPIETTVSLIGFKAGYRQATPKSGNGIAKKIIEHCLELFALGGDSLPKILLQDEQEPDVIDLAELYRTEFRAAEQVRRFNINDIQFEILDVLVRRPATPKHTIYLCGHKRAVTEINIANKLSVLQGEYLEIGNERLAYYGYVSSSYLDANVNVDRMGYDIPKHGEIPLNGQQIFWGDLVDSVFIQVEEYLRPYIEEMQRKSFHRVSEFARLTEPRYAVLLSKRREAISSIPCNLNETQLDAELHKILHEWKLEVRQSANSQLSQQEVFGDSGEHETVSRILADLQEVSKSELAEYVVYRATIISFFERLLGSEALGRFPAEEDLHKLIFPLRETNQSVDYDDHNLWILDERLAYHHFLASDVSFRKQSQSPIAIDSSDRPDIIIYDRPFAYTPGELDIGSVVIVEFKRPERNNYSEESSPIAQVLRYVKQIRSGQMRRPDGSLIEHLPESTPIYCYIIATMTDKLREDAKSRGFTETPDRQGYFDFNSNGEYRAYIELVSYRKILTDAKMRNKVFFDKLDIPVRPRA